jgi:hypothetical protein
MKALLSYVSDLIVPFSKGEERKRGADILVDSVAYQSAVNEAMVLWTPLLGLNLPNWVQHSRDPPGLAATLRNRSALGSKERDEFEGTVSHSNFEMKSTDLTSPSPYAIPIPPPNDTRTSGARDQITPAQADVLKEALAAQQKQQQLADMAREGARSILLTRATLRGLLRKELLFQNQNKDLFRR